ncbi:DUF7147 family protein [Priestia taiwanensis]|uniref:DUF7147 domain-containing protein n=1 Tax=Priestia taiwanensis TaxID=1347902 RepID=A0A917EQJ9_9BACI|nr:methylthioribose kinase [Priestia taiwanensis]MBM7362955.1 hypothetical protein [Priestia taiwanensis]GGE66429.1 hypothetical protein GCM10007140_15790 [Priestia taiwanensis]
MIQRFIELGEGYSDLYELLELARTNKHRLAHLLSLETVQNGRKTASFVIILHPTTTGKFQPLYVCREGIALLEDRTSQRVALFEELAKELDKNIISFEVKPSSIFPEKELYYAYLIGILRLNHLIPPLQ